MPTQLRFLTDTLTTPIGELVLISDEAGRLRAADWQDYADRMHRLLARHYGAPLVPATRERNPFGLTAALAAYFEGDVHAIDALPVATAGTAFQESVWQALRSIPAGQTMSYSELARRLGRPAAIRAVGLANGANPIGIIVPCHRVIGANGSLTGYGGGLERKRWLLKHEATSRGVEPEGPATMSPPHIATDRAGRVERQPKHEKERSCPT